MLKNKKNIFKINFLLIAFLFAGFLDARENDKKEVPAAQDKHVSSSVKENFSLEETLDQVMKNSLEVFVAMSENRAAKAVVKEAESAYWPQVGVSAQYTFVDPVPSIDFGGKSFDLGTNHNFDAHLEFQMRVFDFGKTAYMVKASKNAEELAGYKTEVIRQNLSFETIRLFYSLIFLEKSLGVQEAELKDLEQNLVLMKNRIRAGIATDYDALNTEVRIALSKSRKIDIENSIAIQKIQLNRLMGREENSPLNLQGELKYTKVAVDDQNLLEKGQSNRLEIILTQKTKVLAENRLKMAETERYPDLFIGGTAGYKNGYPTDYTALQPNMALVAKIQVPLFSGFRVSSKIEEKKALLDAANADYENMEKKVRADILSAIKDVKSGEEKLTASDLQVQQARDAVSRSMALYNAGTITSRDMLDARTALLQVELMRLQTLFQYIMSDYNLRRATGDHLWQNSEVSGDNQNSPVPSN